MRKGTHFTLAQIEKLKLRKRGSGFLFRKHSQKSKNKMSLTRTGRKYSESHCRHISEALKEKGIRPPNVDPELKVHRGENHPNWKGGITPLTQQIRHCFRYRQWRSDIFTRDNFTCVICGKWGGTLNADHHPKTFAEIFHQYKPKTLEETLLFEEFWNINNGRTLCEKCHKLNKKKS